MTPWPNPDAPGVPLNPERSDAHWISWRGDDPELMWWFAHDQEWVQPSEPGRVGRVTMANNATYVAPCHIPAEVAAQVEAAGLAMREACVPAAWRGVQEYQQSEDHLLLQQIGLAVQAHIEALPLPTPALDALLAEARREGMREALSQAQSYEPVSFSSDGIEIPGALIGARSAKRVIVEAISATLDDAVAEKGAK